MKWGVGCELRGGSEIGEERCAPASPLSKIWRGAPWIVEPVEPRDNRLMKIIDVGRGSGFIAGWLMGYTLGSFSGAAGSTIEERAALDGCGYCDIVMPFTVEERQSLALIHCKNDAPWLFVAFTFR